VRFSSSLNRWSSSSALPRSSFSCGPRRPEQALGEVLAGLALAPSIMLSITVIRLSALVSWKVRTMPDLATCEAEVWSSVAPSKLQCAPGGRGRPVEAGDQVEERRLAGAVRPDQGGDDAALDLEVVDVDGGMPPKLRTMLSTLRIGPASRRRARRDAGHELAPGRRIGQPLGSGGLRH
jgi:hypothetical protein